ncbi:MAG: DUF2541 domain-containing protein [Pseudomonadota bacterium]
MLLRLVLSGFALFATGMLTVAEAQINKDDKWVLLGTRDVDLTLEKDTIDVTKAKGKFKGLRLQAKSGNIELSRVQVTYGNGAVHNEDRRIDLKSGERTKPIDLRGEERFVDSIGLVYKTQSGSTKKAVIEVWGVQSPDGARTARPVAGQIATKPTEAKPTEAKPGQVTAGGDVLFGTQKVGFGVDRDVIRVGANVGKFDRIRLRVLDNDIFIKELKVVYANGDPDTIAVNAEIKQNSRTEWLPLKGDRFINEIQMNYRSKPSFKGQARIEVLGEYAEGWLGPEGEGRKYNQGWVLLGSQSAGFIGFDSDTIPVGRNQGGFQRIRVTARERAITLNELRIVYASGQEQVVPVKTKVEADSTYGPVDLDGSKRAIKEIKARYRSRFIDASAKGKGNAVVEIWAQH